MNDHRTTNSLVEARESLPRVDIVISTFNEAACVESCLQLALGQDYPQDLLTVWLVDGGSTDRTVEKAEEWSRRDARLKVIATGKRLNLPEALNVLMHEGSAPIVAKVDAHGYPSPSFIRRAVTALLEDDQIGCVGGRPIQYGETSFGRALAIARGSRVGVGGSEYAGRTVRRDVSTVQCGVYRRAALDAVGWFDPEMQFGEDDELNWRIVRRGYRILLDTGIQFHYLTRSTWTAAFRQYRNYGRARVMVVRKHPQFLRWYHLAPAALVTALTGLAAGAVVTALSAWLLLVVSGGYLALLSVEAVRLARGRSVRVSSIVAAFVALHAGYGIGMIAGLLSCVGDRLQS
jgi:cellulose synthase/poly-beta-1,6-N-acetylglucosamine synthase-like glycosyltransferase